MKNPRIADELRQEALDYHKKSPRGKIEVIPSKPHATQRDLALAYSPGVAEPCLEIEKNPETVYDYTGKGNLVAVISNGTAVLGLGDIGAEASKPVMEGKGLLFKVFAGINVFDIEINEKDPDKFIEIVKGIAPTFGGINLEDIKAPEAFYIEERLKKELPIPLMHDDQHGTAIISAAALLNALELAEKDIKEVKLVVNGAGAAAISCAKLYLSLGVRKENLFMCDSKGVITSRREDLNDRKKLFINDTPANTLDEIIDGTDVFVGLSTGDVLKPEMLAKMAENPIVFALANPNPEIKYDLAVKTRPDVIMATGRSDYPNQVNNVLGFPYIFRGALDVNASEINEEMKLGAVHALADLAKEPVSEEVLLAYNLKKLNFGKNYIIPKPFDERLITRVSMAVAKAAIDSGVARKQITDWEAYRLQLLDRMGKDDKLIRAIQNRARLNCKKIIMADAEEFNVLKAALILKQEGIAEPILLGHKDKILQTIKKNKLEVELPIIDPFADDQAENREKFTQFLWEKGARKGITHYHAEKLVTSRSQYGALLLEHGYADGLLIGYSKDFKTSLQPIKQAINKKGNLIAGVTMFLTHKKPIFLCDTSINENLTAQQIVELTRMIHQFVKSMAIRPRIALLSNENFTQSNDVSRKMAEAAAILHRENPEIVVDGEIQADTALNHELMKNFPFSRLDSSVANVFIFPDQLSANITSKMLRGLGVGQMIGPMLIGLEKSVNIMPMGSSVEEIVNLATVTVLEM
ncbi:NADP-dependent malic enzyme [Ornithobacterium rhinotracheale]|uniref:NADP-dependent malic enzyme n=1 Tax=Ornithobacterium rhinotracheale TaxID=28251 RepID=UPI00129C3679|nr:NADP-dependent malic enzyme [Ornithobacterium rhinotracheale]MRJ08025.1 NADP-dependent malic enzyme [Ornithobacterium rhinotracheale]UOH78468.1 NADP-dependent malic enzyme [Ornithobacterium rhinotracheale]